MARDGAWGDEVTLAAAAQAFQVDIRVWDTQTRSKRLYAATARETGPRVAGRLGARRSRSTARKIQLLYDGDHYDSTTAPARAAPRGMTRRDLERILTERIWNIDQAKSSAEIVNWEDTWETPELLSAIRRLPPGHPLQDKWNLTKVHRGPAVDGRVRCSWAPTPRCMIFPVTRE